MRVVAPNLSPELTLVEKVNILFFLKVIYKWKRVIFL
jgi:hypothetical protein